MMIFHFQWFISNVYVATKADHSVVSSAAVIDLTCDHSLVWMSKIVI